MLLGSTIGLWAPAERVRKATTFWDRVKKVIGPKTVETPDTEVQTVLHAAALVGGSAQALESIGVDNAIALVVDGKVVYEDRTGRPDDLEALLAAMDALAPKKLTTLELVVEHHDTGLHYVISLAARGVHQADDTTAEVTIAGRVVDLCPRPNEPELDYHERVARLIPSAAQAEAHVATFLRFVERLKRALGESLPDVRIGAPSTDVRVRQPGSTTPIDAYSRYCPEVDQAAVDQVVWTLAKRWAWRPPWTVIDGSGAKVGKLDAFDNTAAVSLFAPEEPWTVDAWTGDWSSR